MAKAEPQRSKVVKDRNGRELSIGDTFTGSTGTEYRYLGLGGDGRVTVKYLPKEDRYLPATVGVTVTDENDGANLYLMQEEALLITALTELLSNLRRGTPKDKRKAASSLDGTHDVEYWSERIRNALLKTGIKLTDERVRKTYWELGALLESYAEDFYRDRLKPARTPTWTSTY